MSSMLSGSCISCAVATELTSCFQGCKASNAPIRAAKSAGLPGLFVFPTVQHSAALCPVVAEKNFRFETESIERQSLGGRGVRAVTVLNAFQRWHPAGC